MDFQKLFFLAQTKRTKEETESFFKQEADKKLQKDLESLPTPILQHSVRHYPQEEAKHEEVLTIVKEKPSVVPHEFILPPKISQTVKPLDVSQSLEKVRSYPVRIFDHPHEKRTPKKYPLKSQESSNQSELKTKIELPSGTTQESGAELTKVQQIIKAKREKRGF